MFKTLRSQLVLSHILPSLVIIPLMGIALVYFLETRLILPRLEEQLADEALVLAKIARGQPQIFKDAQLSGSLLKDLDLESSTRVMILNQDGVLLASSDTADASRLNEVINVNGVKVAQSGMIARHLDFSQGLHGEVIDVFVPVNDPESHLMGIIRVSYRYTTVAEQLMQARFLILGILTTGTLLSAMLGFLLALNISQPISQVTQAIVDLARGDRADRLLEQGPAEIKLLEQAANFLVDRLKELEQSRRQLLANLVHELGRPLGGLRIGIQVLRRGAKDNPLVLDELLEGMETETAMLGRVLEDLSHLHDQVIGTLELDFQKVSLSAWLYKVLVPAKEAAHKKGLEWDMDIPEGLPELKIDPQRITQVIGNLTANAIKYTPKGGTVSVSAGEAEDMVWIRVSDTGPGIPLEEQDQIFEPFFRGTQRQRIKQGMGLGLSIARSIVIAHNGRLEVQSTPGLGSHFTIWLPKRVDIQHLSQVDKSGAIELNLASEDHTNATGS